MLSSTWDVISRAERPPVTWINRSASVDFPWSIWAMMLKLRILVMSADNFDHFAIFGDFRSA
jgi:hypothetical protein